MTKPILCLDFDGVIHSYSSGWKGASVIPDPPVPGALEFIAKALNQFEVAIFSSRSHQWGGRRAMKRWMLRHLIEIGMMAKDCAHEDMPYWWYREISKTAFADPWPDEVDFAARVFVSRVKWPLFKPAALVTIDDRALTFTGIWPALDEIKSFRPWNKRTSS